MRFFSSIVKLVSIHTMLALNTLLDLELEKLYFKTNFIHGNLYEEIYRE